MSKSAKSIEGRTAASTGQLWLRLPGLVREALYETVIGAGLACVDEVLETERVALCGERYAHLVDREASRAGHVASSLVLGGRRVAVKRPRVRSADGHELKLPSWQEWSSRDPLQQRAVEQMVLGIGQLHTGHARRPAQLPFAFVHVPPHRRLGHLMLRQLAPDPLKDPMCCMTLLARRVAVALQNRVDEGAQWPDHRPLALTWLALGRARIRQGLAHHPPMYSQLGRNAFDAPDPELIFPAYLLE
jgi:hypothetical protein